MPSPTPSDTSGYLRRPRSFSSVQPQQLKHAKSFNTSELAHHEALAAAELAFQRARERFAEENGYEYNSTACTTRLAPLVGGPKLARRQSVRFTGSNAIRTRELPHTRREAYSHQDSTDQGRVALRPEYVETCISSEPSSYRKLRKAKSMFAPGKPTSMLSVEGAPTSKAHFKRESMRSSEGHNSPSSLPDRRLRRSFSFLRGVTDRLSTTNQQYSTNDATIQIARNQYLRHLEEQRVEEQQPHRKFSGRPKSHRDFRHTVRTSSTNSFNSAIQPYIASIRPPKVKSIDRKARTVSQTLKWALNKVFRRPLSDEPKLPEQHIPATKTYYGERFGDDRDERHSSPIPSPDVQLLRRMNSRGSIIRSTTDYNETAAHNGGFPGVIADDDSSNQQSRVTSWADSVGGNNINLPRFIERKRLSVIKEDGGPHQPSSSARACINPNSGYSVFQQPVRLDNVGPTAAQRVYSALQKEILKSEPATAQDHSEPNSDINSEQTSMVPPHRGRPWRFSADGIAMDGQPTKGAQILGAPVSGPMPFDPSQIAHVEDSALQSDERTFSLLDCEQKYAEPMNYLTPQQIANLNEPKKPAPKKPLREGKIITSPTALQIERTTSASRHVAQDVNEQTDCKEDEKKDTGFNTWLPHSHSLIPIRKSSTTMSESAYSRTESGHSPRAVESSMSLPKSDSSGGTAVIKAGGLQSTEPSLPASTQRPSVSNQSSAEWLKWMSSEVSLFEDLPQHDLIYNAPPTRESGHRRENAQWDVEDTTIGNPYEPLSPSMQSLSGVQVKLNARPVLQERMSRSNIERTQSYDVEATGKNDNIAQKENTPKERSLTLLDKRLTTVAANRFAPPIAGKLDGLRTKTSKLNLSLRSEKKDPLTSAISRNSPERAERLRRLHQRSPQSPNKTPTSMKIASNSDTIEKVLTPSAASPRKLNRAEQSFSSLGDQATGTKALVSGFLKSRRSQMRFSDESGSDPAFL